MLSRDWYIIYFNIISNSSSNRKIVFSFKRHNKNYSVHNVFVLLITLKNDIVPIFWDIEIANVMKFAILNDLIR